MVSERHWLPRRHPASDHTANQTQQQCDRGGEGVVAGGLGQIRISCDGGTPGRHAGQSAVPAAPVTRDADGRERKEQGQRYQPHDRSVEHGRLGASYAGDPPRSPPTRHKSKEGAPDTEDRADQPNLLPIDIPSDLICPEGEAQETDDQSYGQGGECPDPDRAPGNRPAGPFGLVIHGSSFEKVLGRTYAPRYKQWSGANGGTVRCIT